jgi:hypothetical protein
MYKNHSIQPVKCLFKFNNTDLNYYSLAEQFNITNNIICISSATIHKCKWENTSLTDVEFHNKWRQKYENSVIIKIKNHDIITYIQLFKSGKGSMYFYIDATDKNKDGISNIIDDNIKILISAIKKHASINELNSDILQS